MKEKYTLSYNFIDNVLKVYDYVINLLSSVIVVVILTMVFFPNMINANHQLFIIFISLLVGALMLLGLASIGKRNWRFYRLEKYVYGNIEDE